MLVSVSDLLFYFPKQMPWPHYGCNILLTVIAISTLRASWGWAHRFDQPACCLNWFQMTNTWSAPLSAYYTGKQKRDTPVMMCHYLAPRADQIIYPSSSPAVCWQTSRGPPGEKAECQLRVCRILGNTYFEMLMWKKNWTYTIRG